MNLSSSRGHLRILLGAAPGVGKTYAMLREGHRLKASGRDVVIGLVETHNRPETVAQIGDLEVVPRARYERGSVVQEDLDVRAVLARKPDVVLIDELAHTNPTGAPRERRYEDVEVLLDSGIDVITTVNIQHIESLHDVVESITGIQVRETVPDRFVQEADEVQLIDLPVDSLLERMEAGHIYPPDQALRAIQHFFRPGNLNALRELALRHTAAGVDDVLEEYMREHEIEAVWPAADRILVWLVPDALAGVTMRKAFRLASGLHGELVVALPTEGYDEYEIRRTEHLAVDLGATVERVGGTCDAAVIANQVREANANVLVLAQRPSTKGRFLRKEGLTEQLHGLLDHVDIYLIDAIEQSG